MPRHLLVTNDYPPKPVESRSTFTNCGDVSSPSARRADRDVGARYRVLRRRVRIVIERIPAKTLFLPTRAPKEPSNRRSSVTSRIWCCSTGVAARSLRSALSVPYGVVVHGAEVTRRRIPIVRRRFATC